MSGCLERACGRIDIDRIVNFVYFGIFAAAARQNQRRRRSLNVFIIFILNEWIVCLFRDFEGAFERSFELPPAHAPEVAGFVAAHVLPVKPTASDVIRS